MAGGLAAILLGTKTGRKLGGEALKLGLGAQPDVIKPNADECEALVGFVPKTPDEFRRYGRVLAAELVRGPRVLRAVRHEAAGGVPGYYDPDGRPLRKAFLRSPLRFTRISSRFTVSRRHPILDVRRPHLGVAYAAPFGTPVVPEV